MSTDEGCLAILGLRLECVVGKTDKQFSDGSSKVESLHEQLGIVLWSSLMIFRQIIDVVRSDWPVDTLNVQ